MAGEQKYVQLNSWLDIIKQAVQELRIDQHIFWEVQEIIRTNHKIHTPGDFNGWMAKMYSSAMSVAIRRQVDEDTRSISFLRLLEEISDHPDVISRERFVSFYKGALEQLGQFDFDRNVGEGLDHVDSKTVESEIGDLKEKTDALRHYVNKRIAHHDEKEFTGFPKFQDVDDAVDFLENLLKRYLLLFRGVGLTQALPVGQHDWKAVFLHRWIEDVSPVRQ
ncbi:MAG: hypothetical protein ACRD1J_08645 [Terriglobia bacterium]